MLINELDVDTELPLDCDFDDITTTALPLPLPGETTRLSIIFVTCATYADYIFFSQASLHNYTKKGRR